MNVNRARVFTRVKNRQIPDNQEIELIKRGFLDECKYPIGAIPGNILDQYPNIYPEMTVQQNYEFCRQFIFALLDEYYTTTELEICSVYMLQLIYRHVFFPQEELFTNYVDQYLETHSDKPDIEYCLNQMRYRKLKALIHDPNALHVEEIDSLIEVLD